jgi:hypothetical protein
MGASTSHLTLFQIKQVQSFTSFRVFRTHKSVQIVSSIGRDALLNGYSLDYPTIKVPRFTRDLLSKDLSVDNAAQMGAGSCAFDLAARLGLLPDQPNERFGEFDTFRKEQIIHKGDRYCGRISRHGLVLLISKHLQRIEWEGGNSVVVLTDIGRFKIYEHDDCTYVHFDGSRRLATIPLYTDQMLEDILRAARGEYGFTSRSGDIGWECISLDELDLIAVTEYLAVLRALIYMPGETVQRWELIREFSS